jgi:DNA-binding CsgD family transcriptional regulator
MLQAESETLVGLKTRLLSLEVERQVYAGVMERLLVGAIILDETGQVLRANPTAEQILTGGDGLKLHGGRPHASSAAQDRELQGVLRDALGRAAEGSQQPVRALSLSRPSGQRDLGIVVQPVGGQRPCVAIFVRDPERNVAVENEMLRNLFGLTPAEAEVARKLAQGLSLEQAAAALHISRNTARAHLRSIFSKSGITRQSDLVRILLNSAAVLGLGVGFAVQ